MTPNPAAEGRPVYAFGPFRLDVTERRLLRDGTEIALTRKTFDLLLALVEGAGRLQTREALIQALWPDTIVEEHSLTWHLSALRRALGDTGDAPSYIETVRGHGYRFIAPVAHRGTAEVEPAPDVKTAGRLPDAAKSRRGLVLAGVLGVVLLAAAVALLRRPANGDATPAAPIAASQ